MLELCCEYISFFEAKGGVCVTRLTLFSFAQRGALLSIGRAYDQGD